MQADAEIGSQVFEQLALPPATKRRTESFSKAFCYPSECDRASSGYRPAIFAVRLRCEQKLKALAIRVQVVSLPA